METGVDLDLLELALVVEWHRAVEEQVVVVDAVHTAVGQQQLHVFLQFLAHREAVSQFLDEVLLLGRELVGMPGVDGGETAAGECVFLAVEGDGAFVVIDILKQLPVLHAPFGMRLEEIGLELEAQYRDGLVHLRGEAYGLLVDMRVGVRDLGHELGAGVLVVMLHCEGGQRHEVDAIAVFERDEVGIAQGEPDDAADARVIARCRTHPQDVVVAPRDVPMLVLAHHVENLMCPGTAVENIAEHVQVVYGEPLYDIGDGDDEVVGTAGGDDGVYDAIDICGLVDVFGALVEQLLYDVREVGGQGLAHFGAGIFARHVATDGHQPVYGDVIPVVDVFLGLFDQL